MTRHSVEQRGGEETVADMRGPANCGSFAVTYHHFVALIRLSIGEEVCLPFHHLHDHHYFGQTT